MKRIPWWTLAAIAAGLWLLVGNFGRFRHEVPAGAATPPPVAGGFDPSTAHPVEPSHLDIDPAQLDKINAESARRREADELARKVADETQKREPY